MRGNRNSYLVYFVALVCGFICTDVFATGCIGTTAVSGDPTTPKNPATLQALSTSIEGAQGTVPFPYSYAIVNTSTNTYAIYTITAQYSQSSNGKVTVTPIIGLPKTGTSAGGVPPASTGCPSPQASGTSSGGAGGGSKGSGGGGLPPPGCYGNCTPVVTVGDPTEP